ncbi:MAG: dTDP-4-dehydrorhamnose 3,5-epimerase [Lacisediminihabitans sp.]
MQIRELSIPGAFEVTPVQWKDDRGVFMEWYRFDLLSEVVGHPLDLRQANTSVSKRGVVRGIHFADIPRGQAKYVTVSRGAVLDFVVDLRVGSQTFGKWDFVKLDDVDHRALYVSEGLGHAFISLTEDAAVSYLVSDVYNPAGEHGINPLDPQIALDFTLPKRELILSAKDREAPSLAEAQASGLLPTMEQAQGYYDSLNEGTE